MRQGWTSPLHRNKVKVAGGTTNIHMQSAHRNLKIMCEAMLFINKKSYAYTVILSTYDFYT
jgi:hypothetical protein